MSKVLKKPEITGKTRIVPMIGHPISQVQTPGPMNLWFAEHGVDAAIMPMDLRPERVSDFFDVLKATENCVGCSITMPHKQAAFAAADEVSERARRARSVNIIRRLASGKLVGDMTDGIAMVAALESHEIDIRDRCVLIVGAGGAGTAIAHEVAEKGASSLVILETDKMRRQALLADLTRHYPELSVYDKIPARQPIQIAINASPAGMSPNDPHPVPVDQIADALIVSDAVTKPDITPWLADADKRGLKIQTGREMALAQVSIQLHFLRFRALPSDKESDRQAVHGLAE